MKFYLGRTNSIDTYLSYHPDSRRKNNSYNEFDILYEGFIAKNKLNNSGDIPRLWSWILNISHIIKNLPNGEFAELGVWRGNTSSILAYYAKKNNRRLFLLDTFEGFLKDDLTGIDEDKEIEFSNTSLETVAAVIGDNFDVCTPVVGHFPSSITRELSNNKFSIVSLDCDLYEPTKAALDFFYSRMDKGALFLLHDYSSLQWDGSKKAIDEFCQITGEQLVLLPDKSGSAILKIHK